MRLIFLVVNIGVVLILSFHLRLRGISGNIMGHDRQMPSFLSCKHLHFKLLGSFQILHNRTQCDHEVLFFFFLINVNFFLLSVELLKSKLFKRKMTVFYNDLSPLVSCCFLCLQIVWASINDKKAILLKPLVG